MPKQRLTRLIRYVTFMLRMGATPFSRLIVSTGIQFRVHGGNLLSGLHFRVKSFLSYKYKKEEIFIPPL